MQTLTLKWKRYAVSLLIGLIGVGILLRMLAEFHEETSEPLLMALDLRIQSVVHGYASPNLTRVMLALTWIGSPSLLLPGTAVIAAFLWWRRLHRDTVTFFIAMIGTGLLTVILKLYFRRLRPNVPWALVDEKSFSFPSGHSIVALVFYGSLLLLGLLHLRTLWERLAVSVLMVGAIVGIGLSRIYLGIHYPSDVAAGYLVGCIWLTTVVLAEWEVRRMGRRHNWLLRAWQHTGGLIHRMRSAPSKGDR